jgi:chromosome partitioning protein
MVLRRKVKLKRVVRVWIWLIRKGGSAKTISAVNFSAGLACLGRKVLLIDFDPQANATRHMGINPRELHYSVNTLFTTIGFDPRSAIQTRSFTIGKQTYEVDVLPAHKSLDETDLSMQATQVGMFHPVIEVLQEDYDDIVIDTRPTRSLLTISALIAATHAVIPMEAGVFALDALEDTLEDIENVKKGLNPDLKLVGVLPTRVRDATNLAGAVLGEANKRYGHLLIRYQAEDGQRLLFIRESIKLGEAPGFGIPGIAYEPNNFAVRDYLKCVEVLNAQT